MSMSACGMPQLSYSLKIIHLCFSVSCFAWRAVSPGVCFAIFGKISLFLFCFYCRFFFYCLFCFHFAPICYKVMRNVLFKLCFFIYKKNFSQPSGFVIAKNILLFWKSKWSKQVINKMFHKSANIVWDGSR